MIVKEDWKKFIITLIVASLSWHGLIKAQGVDSDARLRQQADHELAEKNYDEAERDYTEVIRRHPADLLANVFLGIALFRHEKYAESIRPYESALALEKSGNTLSISQHRILIDQLVMAYGISGQFGKAHALLDKAIPRDPEYPLNYYNLACTFAEESNKSQMLANLSLAFKYKDHMIRGEKFPDPRSDSSFQTYFRDPDFVKLMRSLGYR